MTLGRPLKGHLEVAQEEFVESEPRDCLISACGISVFLRNIQE